MDLELWQWLAIAGLALGIFGAYLVYRVGVWLIQNAAITYDGEVSLPRTRRLNRIGWSLIGLGFAAQTVSVLLSGTET
jgi:hypothetical protein